MNRTLHAGLCVAALLLPFGGARAQVSRATPADLAPLPSFFKPDKNGVIHFDATNTVPKPPGMPGPSPAPRDFAGTYDSNFYYANSALPIELAGGGGPGGPPPGKAGPGGPPGAGPPSGPPGGPAGGPSSGQSLSGRAVSAKFAAVKPGTSFNHGLCVAKFASGGNFHPGEVIQTADDIVLLGENGHDSQHIYMNVPHPAHVTPSAYGDAVGRWDGDTLVVDVVGLSAAAAGDNGGPPPRIRFAADTHVTERISKLSNGDLQNQITATNAATGAAVGSETIFLHWRPDLPLLEDICEDFAEAYGAGYTGAQAPNLNADKVAP